MHTAIFEDWNGTLRTIQFKAKTTIWSHLCKCAHAAILKEGYTTVRLALVDGDPVEYSLAYR